MHEKEVIYTKFAEENFAKRICRRDRREAVLGNNKRHLATATVNPSRANFLATAAPRSCIVIPNYFPEL